MGPQQFNPNLTQEECQMSEKLKLFYFSKFQVWRENQRKIFLGKNATHCCKKGQLGLVDKSRQYNWF
jgi:hypothetical protein